MSEIRVRVKRTSGIEEEFTVNAGEYTTVLDALEAVRSSQDESLLYRHSCHHGSCGTCGVLVNGEPMLACTTPLAGLSEPVILAPLPGFRQVGDLAVEPDALYADFPGDATYLRESETNGDSPAPPDVQGFVRFENCIECGLCESACPVNREERHPFMGPASLAAFARELANRPSRAEEILSAVDGPEGVWGCDRELRCSAVCPTGVNPARHIAVLQRAVTRNASR